MSKKRFTIEENRMLTEVYRRLNYFHKGDLNSDILSDVPSRAKCLKSIGLIEPLWGETPCVYNWYKLTENGKKYFSNYITEISESHNLDLFEGEIVTFDFDLFSKTIV